MDTTGPLAPPVVAVMVVHEPGAWFDEVLTALAAQDYTNLRCLFLVAGERGDLPARIRDLVPNAFVRGVAGNPGFGAAANEVLRLVEGDNGFFCFLHDDVALDPSAIRLLVEELYRSNAGIVGPKLVNWSRPNVLQHVGYDVDRFAEIDPIVEPGEVDQEQHDGVRDVFAVPAACLLVRADLFRTVGGFDPTIAFHGDDLDLCWRAHLGGARVVVVPAARGRHRGRLAERRPDLRHEAIAERNRMRAVATLTGGRRLPLVTVQLVLVTLTQVLIGVLSGHFRRAGSTLAALVGMAPRTPAFMARRRGLARLRRVPDAEVAGLQLRGSARVSAYLRSRELRQVDPDSTTERRWRQTAGSAPALAWLSVIVLVLVGSRDLISGGVPRFGEFLAFPASPSGMVGDYLSGWWGHGLGSNTAVPTGMGLIGVASVATLFNMGLLNTLAVVGMLFAGHLGIWRLASLFPTARARVAALVVYAAVPLPTQLLGGGHWTALACYAAGPWGLHLLRRFAGIESSGSVTDTKVEHYVSVDRSRLVRRGAQLILLAAVAFAFAPAFALLLVGMAALMALGTVVVGGSSKAALTIVAASVGAVIVGFVLNLPWSLSLLGGDGWTAVVGVPVATSRSLGVGNLLRFLDDRGGATTVSILLFLPVVVSPLVARAWRFTWAVRGALLVFGFGALAVLDDRADLPFRMPEPGVLLVPVAIGMALSAATLAAAFQDDVLAGQFGWRQPLGLLTSVAVVFGVLPGLTAVADGQWGMPNGTLVDALAEFATDPPEGDFRVLWLGDPQVIPVAAYTYQPGIGMAITDDGPITIAERWAGKPTGIEEEVATALRQMAAGATVRGGRLLAPFAIRYIVVPVADGVNGTIENPLPIPEGLLAVLDNQLDMASRLTNPPNYRVFENTAFTPTRSLLTPLGAEASNKAGGDALTQADLTGSTPFAVGAPDRGDFTGTLPPGTVHLAVPYDSGWKLTVGGVGVEPRRAFGSTVAFDLPSGGAVTVTFDTPPTRTALVALQFGLWLALAVAASSLRLERLRRRRGEQGGGLDDTSTIADLRSPLAATSGAAAGGAVDATDDLTAIDVWQVTAPPALDGSTASGDLDDSGGWASWGDES